MAQSRSKNTQTASAFSFRQLVHMSCLLVTTATKSAYSFYRKGPRHPSWGMWMQLMVDVVARMYMAVIPYHPSDDSIEVIDFQNIAAALRSCFPTSTPWPRKKGLSRGHCINTKEIAIDTSLFSTIDVAGPKLATLVQADMELQEPRMLSYKVILGNAAIRKLEPHVRDIGTLLDARPVFSGEKVILYFHGGGWISGSIDSYRKLTGEVSQAASTRVISVAYRLSPEHAFPAHLHDTLIAYCFLLKQGFRPADIIVAGDSAGGNLSLSLTHLLRYMDLPLPAGLVLLSPASNLRYYQGTHDLDTYSDFLVVNPLESPLSMIRIMYAPGQPLSQQMKKELESPLVSPIFGSFAGFPPTLIETGGCEFLYDDNVSLYEKIKRQNPNMPGIVQHDVYDGMPHVFQLIFSYRPEAAKSLEMISSFIHRL